jgi:hypothetical protein
MSTWTFVIEYGDGATLVCQLTAENIDSAVRVFNESKEIKDRYSLPLKTGNIGQHILDFADPIKGTLNVWCSTASGTDGKLVLANIIKTCVD